MDNTNMTLDGPELLDGMAPTDVFVLDNLSSFPGMVEIVESRALASIESPAGAELEMAKDPETRQYLDDLQPLQRLAIELATKRFEILVPSQVISRKKRRQKGKVPNDRTHVTNIPVTAIKGTGSTAEKEFDAFQRKRGRKRKRNEKHRNGSINGVDVNGVDTQDPAQPGTSRNISGVVPISTPESDGTVVCEANIEASTKEPDTNNNAEVALASDLVPPGFARGGFLLALGAGVGKGQISAGIILEQIRRGHYKHIWITISKTLYVDIRRDFEARIGEELTGKVLRQLSNFRKITTLQSTSSAVLMICYSHLRLPSRFTKQRPKHPIKNKKWTQYHDVRDFLGNSEFNGVIILDESHTGKNAQNEVYDKISRMGVYAIKLQRRYPNAKIVYSSATAATLANDFGVMERLNLWGPGTAFKDFEMFNQMMRDRSLSALEFISLKLKQEGAMISKQLSFKGVPFRIFEAPIQDWFKTLYDKSTALWTQILFDMDALIRVHNLTDDKLIQLKRTAFWSYHQTFFRSLIASSKVLTVVEQARKAIMGEDELCLCKDCKEENEDCKRTGEPRKKIPHCVVIGVHSTGEASYREHGTQEKTLPEFISYLRYVLRKFIKCHMTINKSQKANKKKDANITDSDDDELGTIYRGREENQEKEDEDLDMLGSNTQAVNQKTSQIDTKKPSSDTVKIIEAPEHDDVLQVQNKLLGRIDNEFQDLPGNFLDVLISELEKIPGCLGRVAELTGRRRKVFAVAENVFVLKERADEETYMQEMEAFKNGEKIIAIISEAASTGISLHVDPAFKNKMTRVHITAELSFAADRVKQQLGRTHRANQEKYPSYIYITSCIYAEARFASIILQRLKSLDALTVGDRRTELAEKFINCDFADQYGKRAVSNTLRLLRGETPEIEVDVSKYDPDEMQVLFNQLKNLGLQEIDRKRLPKSNGLLQRIFNKLLGVSFKEQEMFFTIFRLFYYSFKGLSDTKSGVRAATELVNVWVTSKTELRKMTINGIQTHGPVMHYELLISCGTQGDDALNMLLNQPNDDFLSGFYRKKIIDQEEGETRPILRQPIWYLENLKIPIDKTEAIVDCQPDEAIDGIEETDIVCELYAPNKPVCKLTLLQVREFCKGYNRSSSDPLWDRNEFQTQHDVYVHGCDHEYLYMICSSSLCRNGCSQATRHVVVGDLLGVWKELTATLETDDLLIVVVKPMNESKFFGVEIPKSCLGDFKARMMSTWVPNTQKEKNIFPDMADMSDDDTEDHVDDIFDVSDDEDDGNEYVEEEEEEEDNHVDSEDDSNQLSAESEDDSNNAVGGAEGDSLEASENEDEQM